MPSIVTIQPLDRYLIEVRFDNGSTIILNMAGKLHTARFRQLRDKKLFESATTDGGSIRWNDLIEISTTEIFEIAKK